MAADTRQRLIDSARQRFYRDGFRNVGIDAVLGDVGISKTAFYKHFSCKDDLMPAVLEDHDRWFREVFMEMIRRHGGEDPVSQLLAVMDATGEVIDKPGFRGCIFVNAAMEFPLPHDPAHAASLRHKRAIEEFVHDLAERARVADPVALAAELCMIIEGAYVTRTVTNDPATIVIARRLAEQTIARHVPPA